ncbi:MAG: flagellar basal body-associated FliL family protein [Gammaproteobacteria bacterium]|nr:flagellar basal body-associated FliL family protein [Gammaproteobacteria bacterium]
MAAEDTEVAQATEAPAKGGIVKTLGIAVGLFILMLASQLIGPIMACKILPDMMPGCGGAPTLTEETAKPEKDLGPPQYLALDPALVVSFEDQNAIRFLQVTVEVMAREEAAIEAVTTHTPVIRNNLLMLMGGKTLTDLTSRDGKEQLRQDALTEVQAILSKFGDATIEDLYFTSFVVQ